jgi:hypothetical protein
VAFPLQATEVDVTQLAPSARAEAQRILDAAARRLLRARLDADSVGTATGADDGLSDHGPDQGALLVKGEVGPIARADRERRPGGGE